MALPSFFVFLVYISGYLILAFSAVCLACGLFQYSNLSEEYTGVTKSVIRVFIAVILVCHLLFLIFERVAIVQTLIGILAHVAYYFCLLRFPFIDVMSIPFLAACALFFVSIVAWFMFFSSNHEIFYANQLTPGYAVAFFYVSMVFLVPSSLFVGLTVSDSDEGTGGLAATTGGDGVAVSQASATVKKRGGGIGLGIASGSSLEDVDPSGIKKKRRSLISTIFQTLGSYANAIIPSSRRKKKQAF